MEITRGAALPVLDRIVNELEERGDRFMNVNERSKLDADKKTLPFLRHHERGKQLAARCTRGSSARVLR